MKESDALVRLQEIDLALMRHKSTLGAMPQTKKIHTIRAARKKLASEISKIVGQRKDVEMDLEENVRAYGRMEEIVAEIQLRYESGEVSYREVSNLEEQLTSLAKKMEKRSYQRKELQARLDKIRTAERNARAMDDKLIAEADAQADAYKQQTADIARDVKMLTREREEVLQSITPDVLARYDAAVKRFGGLAVETMRGNTPSVCRVTIPPSSFGDIRRGPAICECPYCHRMLVTDGMFDLD